MIDILEPYVPQIEAPPVETIPGLIGGSSGSGSGGSGAQQIYGGASPPSAPDDPTLPALWYPDGGGATLQWDTVGQAWV